MGAVRLRRGFLAADQGVDLCRLPGDHGRHPLGDGGLLLLGLRQGRHLRLHRGAPGLPVGEPAPRVRGHPGLRERVRVLGRTTAVGRRAVDQRQRIDRFGVIAVRLRPRRRLRGMDDVPLELRGGRPGARRLRCQRPLSAGRVLVGSGGGDGHPRLHRRGVRHVRRSRRRLRLPCPTRLTW